MTFSAQLRCIGGCDRSWPLEALTYRCPDCDALLEVVHDLDALRARAGADWIRLFDARLGSCSLPDGSGVWAKREWVAPHVRAENVVSMFEGGTPLLPLERYGHDLGLDRLWIKMCGSTHTGSFKDLGMTVLVSTVVQMVADGIHVPAIACASTGDTSAALAAYAAAAGVRAVVILPRGKISTAQLVQPLANGAQVLAIDTDFDGCMRLATALAERDGVYLANSMNSLRLEGQKTVAVEIVQQLGWTVPDWIVIPGGNLGNVSALGAGFSMMQALGVIDRAPRICVAQAARANPLYRSFVRGFESFEPVVAETTLASAIQIGAPVSRDKAIRALRRFGGVVEQATEAELAEAAARADLTGTFCCPQTGVALAALEKRVAAGDIGASDRVVVISTASGLKFTDFKVGYHRGELEALGAAAHANQPIELADDYDAVRAAVLEGLERA